MHSKTLLLIALLAPHSAAAFGDLECTTVETCEISGCSANTTPHSIAFDRDLETADLRIGAVTFPLTELVKDADNGITSIYASDPINPENRYVTVPASADATSAFFTQPRALLVGSHMFADVCTQVAPR